jgi:hypothetical protein
VRKWVKLYTKLISDPKMHRLPDATFRACINLIVLAGIEDRDGELGTVEDIAFHLRMDPPAALSHLAALAQVDIAFEKKGVWTLTKWSELQAKSPSDDRENVRTRVKKHRENKTNDAPIESNGNENVTTLHRERNEPRGEESRGDSDSEEKREYGASAPPPKDPANAGEPAESSTNGKHPADLPAQVRVYLENGGKLPAGKLADGSLKAERASAFICDSVTDTPESLRRWGQIVFAYQAMWSPKSYSVMVQDYYLRDRLPGQSFVSAGQRPVGTFASSQPRLTYTPEEAARIRADLERVKHANRKPA